jgi:hypothetical protein
MLRILNYRASYIRTRGIQQSLPSSYRMGAPTREVYWPSAKERTGGGRVYRGGERTGLAKRVEISERAAAGQTDRAIATVLGCYCGRHASGAARLNSTNRMVWPQLLAVQGGALSTLPPGLQTTIQQMPDPTSALGPDTMLATLRSDEAWQSEPLPRRPHLRHSELPQPVCPP